MISEYTLTIARSVLTLASWSLLVPWRWDDMTQSFKKASPSQVFLCIVWAIFNSIIASLFVLRFGCVVLMPNVPDTERILACLGLILGSYFIGVYSFLNLFPTGDLILMDLNASLQMNRNFAAYYNVNSKEKDGIESLANVGVVAVGLLIISAFPTFYFGVELFPDLVAQINLFGTDETGIILFSAFFTLCEYNNMAVTLPLSILMLSTVGGQYRCLEKMKYACQLSRQQMYDRLIQYRSIQLLNDFAVSMLGILMPLVICGSIVVFSILFFIIIKYHQDIPTVTTVSISGFCIVAMFAVRVVTYSLGGVTEASNVFCSSYFSSGCELSNLDKLTLKACKPLVLKVKYLFTVRKDTFLVVVENMFGITMNLLLTAGSTI